MLEEAFIFEKLFDAHKEFRVFKQHREDAVPFKIHLSQNLIRVSKDIFSKKYKLGKYKIF